MDNTVELYAIDMSYYAIGYIAYYAIGYIAYYAIGYIAYLDTYISKVTCYLDKIVG